MHLPFFQRQVRSKRERASAIAHRHREPVEIAERPVMRETLEDYRRVAEVAARVGFDDGLPVGLGPAPGGASWSDRLAAAGFIDLHSRSVGVDIACWQAPPDACVDERGWNLVFG